MWKDNEITYLGSLKSRKLVGALSDGRYIICNYSYGLLRGGYPEIWDPENDSFTEMGSTSGEFDYAVQDGTDIYLGTLDNLNYGPPCCKIYKYNYSSQTLVENNYKGDGTIPSACTTYHDGLFYSWTHYMGVCAIRPTGGYKVLFNPEDDILITDFNALPKSPDNLMHTSNGSFIFYDGDAKAIREIYPNPDYVEPDPTTELINATNQMFTGMWVSEDGIFNMEVSLGQAPGFYTLKITGGTWAQASTTITYDAELDTNTKIIKCYNGTRVDSSRFSEDIIYDGTGEAEIKSLSEYSLTFENHAPQDLEDLFEASVDFSKITL